MTDFDYDVFAQSLGRVMAAFPKFKLQPPKVTELTRIYFDVLKSHDIADVLQAGKACISKHKTFPAVADWLAELPRLVQRPADARQMTVAELDEHERARQLGYEDEPCFCAECESAGVMHRPLRFVPTECLEEFERAFNPRKGALELVGHWAHGEDLRRFYAARDGFFALKTNQNTAPFVRLLALAGVREPGEEG